jgi:hypothetical protein
MDAIAVNAPCDNPSLCGRRWTDMWNQLVPASEVVATDCRVYFGRRPQTDRPTATKGPQDGYRPPETPGHLDHRGLVHYG